MKKIIVTSLLLAPLMLTSCGSSQDKLLTIFTDMTCLSQFSTSASENSGKEGFNMNEYRTKRDSMNQDLKNLMKSSFTKESEFKDAYKALSDKAAFKKQVLESAQKKCQATQGVMDNMFVEIDNDK